METSIKINQIKNIYIIGIEGGGTSALASLLSSLGKEVKGSDQGDHFFYHILKKQKIKVYHEFNKKNIPTDVDLIIYSSAYNAKNNVEVKLCLEKYSQKTLTYTKALAMLFNTYQNNIAVCGTHGKTSVSAMLSYVLKQAGSKPNAIIGANVKQFAGNSLVADSDLFVLEADEYQNKLANYNPNMIILNNIDYDHPDFFKNQTAYEQVFIDFVQKLPKHGSLIVNLDGLKSKKIIKACSGKIITYGAGSNNIIKNIKIKKDKQSFTLDGLGKFTIQLLGRYNVANASAVILACLELGLTVKQIKKHLTTFKGVDRRLEKIGKYNQALIIDDFAHHPTEIKASIKSVKDKYPNKKLITVFHPHTFTRTKALFNDFANSFATVDELIILDIYSSAREKTGKINSVDLVEKIKDNNFKIKKIQNIHTLEACEKYLRKNLQKDNVLLLLGAGDLWKIGQNLIKTKK